jgi:hypothetical protein
MSAARCLLAVPDRRTILVLELLPTFVSHPAPCPGAGFFFERRRGRYAVQKLKLKGAGMTGEDVFAV